MPACLGGSSRTRATDAARITPQAATAQCRHARGPAPHSDPTRIAAPPGQGAPRRRGRLVNTNPPSWGNPRCRRGPATEGAAMNTEAALLQAIHHDPGDGAAWSVLADYLEEQGDPRAELLRLTLALRQAPPRGRRADVKAQEARVQGLLASGV